MLARRATPSGHHPGHGPRDGDNAAPVPPCLGGDDDRHDVPHRGADDRDVWDRRGGGTTAGGGLRPDLGGCGCPPHGGGLVRRGGFPCPPPPPGAGGGGQLGGWGCGPVPRGGGPSV